MGLKHTLAEVVEKTKGSRKETARLLGISEGYLSELLKGNKIPSHDLHAKIMEAHAGRERLQLWLQSWPRPRENRLKHLRRRVSEFAAVSYCSTRARKLPIPPAVFSIKRNAFRISLCSSAFGPMLQVFEISLRGSDDAMRFLAPMRCRQHFHLPLNLLGHAHNEESLASLSHSANQMESHQFTCRSRWPCRLQRSPGYSSLSARS